MGWILEIVFAVTARAASAREEPYPITLPYPNPPLRSSPEGSSSAAKEAASAEAVNARQGITGRLPRLSAVAGINTSDVGPFRREYPDGPHQ